MLLSERTKLHEMYHAQLKDLLDRVQAPTFTDYKENIVTDTPNLTPEPVDENLLSIDDAQEELMNG